MLVRLRRLGASVGRRFGSARPSESDSGDPASGDATAAGARRFDTSPGGLQRIYYRIVMLAVASMLALDLLFGLAFGQSDDASVVRRILYGAVFLFAGIAHQVAGTTQLRRREPHGVALAGVGLLSVLLCVETAGLASAFYLLVFLACVFGALVLRPAKAYVLTAGLSLTYGLLMWAYPAGGSILAGRLDEIQAALGGGKPMDAALISHIVVLCAFLFAGTWVTVGLSTGFREKMGRLEVYAVRDPLTGLPNRRGFMDLLGLQIAKAVHWDWPIAILIVDLDHFWKVNDRFGHAVGDRALAVAARLLRGAAGPLDNVSRIDSDVFAVAAIGAERNNAADLADRIVRTFRGHDWSDLQPGLHVTCSIGVAIRPPGPGEVPVTDLSEVIEEAHRAHRLVKQHGRNGYLLSNDPRVEGPGEDGPGEEPEEGER